MSNLNFKILEILGWKKTPAKEIVPGISGFYWKWAKNGAACEPPHYPSDLNACFRDLEAQMYVDDRWKYESALIEIIESDLGCPPTTFDIVHASAEQRCRAFVKMKEGQGDE